MYRSSSLLVFLRERRYILTGQNQVVRCISWQHKSLSKRHFSDSVKVLTHPEESEEKDGSASTRKSSKQKSSKQSPSKKKLFTIDDVLLEKKDVIRNYEKTEESIKSAGQFQTSADLPKAKIEERELTESESEREVEKETVELKTPQEQLKVEESEETSPTDAEFKGAEEGETVKRKKKSAKYRPDPNRNLKLQIDEINSLNDADNVLKFLDSCFSQNLRSYSKDLVIICALKRLEKLKVQELGKDVETKLQDHLDHNSWVSSMSFTDIVNFLDYFIKGNNEDNKIAYTLLHELCWRLRKSSVNQTLAILGTVKHRLSTDKRKEVYMMGKKRLIENIENVSSPGELLSSMYLIDGKDEAWPRVEEEALIMLHSMDTLQTYRLLYLLALHRSKNTLLVLKARKQLCLRPINLDAIKLKNLFFACEVLRINDPNMLQEMSVNMIELLQTDRGISRNNISLPVLQSCSKIGWNHRDLTSLIMKDIYKNAESDIVKKEMTDFQLASVIVTLGHLNLVQYGDFGLKMAEFLISGKRLKPTNLLNVVHSLACLQKCDKRSVKEVLSPENCSSLESSMEGQPAYLKDNLKRKLLCLYGYLKEDLREAGTGMESQASKWRDQLQEKVKSARLAGLAKFVSEVLMEIAPLEKYTNRNVVTKYGYTIDFEIYVDKNLKAVRLDKTEGMQKVWIKMLDYSGFVQGNSEPKYTGSTAMMLRHLKSEQDAAIVFVPYTNWSRYDKKIDHLLYLETQIKAAVQPETPDTKKPNDNI